MARKRVMYKKNFSGNRQITFKILDGLVSVWSRRGTISDAEFWPAREEAMAVLQPPKKSASSRPTNQLRSTVRWANRRDMLVGARDHERRLIEGLVDP